MICEITAFTFLTMGALAIGLLAGWLGGFVHGSYWSGK